MSNEVNKEIKQALKACETSKESKVDVAEYLKRDNKITFQVIDKGDNFMPEESNDIRKQFLIKARLIQCEVDFSTKSPFVWDKYKTLAGETLARVLTGIKYNDIFKNEYILKTGFDFCISNKLAVFEHVLDINGEVAIQVKTFKKCIITEGDVIAHISFVKNHKDI